MRYYVYILVDDTCKGDYHNEYCDIEYKPFYVGKGDSMSKNKKERHLVHYNEVIKSNKVYNLHKFNKIKKLINEGYEPNFVIVYRDDDENKVLEVEKKLIKFYGKSKDGGILTNISDGGVGGNLFKYVDGLREKLNKINSDRWKGSCNPNYGRKKENTYSHTYKKLYGRHWNSEKKMSESHKDVLREHRYNNLPIVEMICPITNKVMDKLKTVDAIKKYNLSPSRFYKCLNEGGQHKNFYWKYENKELVLLKSKRDGFTPNKIKPPKKTKIFFKENLNDEIEICYNDIDDASSKTGFSVEVIRRKCRYNNLETKIFRYENKEYKFNIKKGRKIKIMSIDEFGNKNIFDSASDAAKKINGANVSTIIAVCRGNRKKHKNLVFKYLNDVKN